MKKKVLVSSILTIALCLSLIAGSTFALFTDSSEFNIAVTSGDVEIKSSAAVVYTYSAEGPVDEHNDKYLKDEKGNFYEHVVQNGGTFLNGGSAEVVQGGTLVINKITPGDKVDVRIKTENLGNVAFRYRYTIKVDVDEGLATGMVLTTHTGAEYEAVKLYTSEWFDVVAANDTTTDLSKVISLELPVFAGNEYQSESKAQEDGRAADDKAVRYTILVEAIQGNAVVTENKTYVELYDVAGAVETAIANGGEVVLPGNFENKVTIEANTVVDIDLNNSAIQDNIVNEGTVSIYGGTIENLPEHSTDNNNGCGFQNNGGNATLTDVKINAGDADDYSNITNGGTVVYNNVDITANGGGIGATNGATVEFNGGKVAITATTTNPRYNIYAVGNGTTVIINDGDFSFTALSLKRAYVYADAGTTVIINGGTFGQASTRSGYTAGILGSGTVIITGGTFGFNPSAWLADGCVAVESNGVWTVSAQ